MEYNVDYYIEKYEAIPEDEWCVNSYNGPNGSHCAMGHCGMRIGKTVTNEVNELVLLFFLISTNVPCVNDGDDCRYQQRTPKQRILAALHDIKKLKYEQQTRP